MHKSFKDNDLSSKSYSLFTVNEFFHASIDAYKTKYFGGYWPALIGYLALVRRKGDKRNDCVFAPRW